MSDVPEMIRFGNGCRHELSRLLTAGRYLLICGKHSLSRIDAEVIPELQKCGIVVKTVVASPEVPLAEVAGFVDIAGAGAFDGVIGWGGGSAMDCAKAVAALLGSPAPAAEYFYGRAALAPRKKTLILVPTTAGTGAEITPNAVIKDQTSGIKQSLRGPGMQADIALVDPELLSGTPQKVMAASGFDSLTQAIEGFLSRKADSITGGMSLMAAQLVLENLAAGCASDHSAFEPLARGTVLGAMAFTRCGLGAVHGIAHPLGSVLHLGHGESCAALLIPVLKRNFQGSPERCEVLASGLGFTGFEELIGCLSGLQSQLGLSAKLGDAGLKMSDFPFIIANCRSGSMRCNPVDLSDEDVRELLEELL